MKKKANIGVGDKIKFRAISKSNTTLLFEKSDSKK